MAYLDLFNREIISYGISKHPSYELVRSCLYRALDVTSDCLYRRTFHSDQGWCYQMSHYVKSLKSEKVFQSMNRKGKCPDNSVIENFFGILKCEIYYGRTFTSYAYLESSIIDWIYYYNNKRLKEKLNWMSPVQYRVFHNIS